MTRLRCDIDVSIERLERGVDVDAHVLIAEIRRLRAERKKLFVKMSEWMTPLFDLRMRVISVQGRIDEDITGIRRNWFEEHGYPHEGMDDG